MSRIVVAMSGGVDSSTVAGLLVEQGHEVIGVHMKLHDAPATAQPGRCCGYDDALDARKVADHLGMPFYVLDLREAFKRSVIDGFVAAYREGRTPNPCVACNGVLKFDVLISRARALGASHLATGHYAQILPGPKLCAAVDDDKDQSYFLFPVAPEALERLMFPLGGLTKPEVRQHAARLGLPVAEKAESMDVCFLPDGDHAALVAASTPEDGSGEIVDDEGRVVGRHDGYWRYTVGQRRGLAVALGFPAYVVRIEPDTKRVVVASESALWHDRLTATGFAWIRPPALGEALTVRLRHRGPLVPANVEVEGGVAQIALLEPARAITAGQATVVYAGNEVLGGGWVQSESVRRASA